LKKHIGKNFSLNNTGKRKKNDFYETPYSMTKQFLLLNLFDRRKTIVEPAAGNGAISGELYPYGFGNVVSYDLYKDEIDFLTDKEKYPQMITNPPYSLAKEFILHAKEIITEKFALLLPLSYLHGKERYDVIWTDKVFPLSEIYVFTRYPLLGEPLRDDGKYETGMQVYAWYVWDKKCSHPPIIKWIDNDEYVLRGQKKHPSRHT
jgi:hypothetical protein